MTLCSGLTLSDPRFAELDRTINHYRGRSDGVLFVLDRARYLFGTLPHEVLHYIASELELSLGDLSQATSTADYLMRQPSGRHVISICLGTHCYLRGAVSVLDRLQAELKIGPGETTADGLFTLIVDSSGESCGAETCFFIDGTRYTVEPVSVPLVLNLFRDTPNVIPYAVI